VEENRLATGAVAMNYLKSNRNALILKRNHPEMRDAVMMLVNAFDGAGTEAKKTE